jgi:hypothetical protein
MLAVSVFVGLLGLVFAARGEDTPIVVAGWLFLLFAVIYAFGVIARMAGRDPPR